MIEFRSDTFTLPTPEMLDAITTATLGDDVWGRIQPLSRWRKSRLRYWARKRPCW